MLCQDSVLKENWPFKRGDLYVVDYERGQRPRECTVTIAVILWPAEQTETTEWYMVAPITFNMTERDPDTDVIINDERVLGRPFAVMLKPAHLVRKYQLLVYTGYLTAKTMNRVIPRMQKEIVKFCEINSDKQTVS